MNRNKGKLNLKWKYNAKHKGNNVYNFLLKVGS